MNHRYGRALFACGNRGRKGYVPEFVIPNFPFAKIRSGRGNGDVGEVEGSENSALFEGRSQRYAMERIRRVSTENENVASEIQNRVGISAILKIRRDPFREEPLPHRSEIEFHARLEYDFASFDDDVPEIRPRRFGEDFRHEVPAFEIVGIPEKGDVRERIEEPVR